MAPRREGRKPAPLTPDQQRFVDEYLKDLNGTQAYIRTFGECTYHTARSESARFLAKPSIRREIDAARQAERKRLRVTAERVTAEIARIAFADPLGLEKPDGDIRRLDEIPVDLRRVIASVKVKRKEPRGGGAAAVEVIEYKFWNKLDALGKLAKRLGLEEPVPSDQSAPDLGEEIRRRVAEVDEPIFPVQPGEIGSPPPTDVADAAPPETD